MGVNGTHMGAGSTTSEDSTLDLSHNDLATWENPQAMPEVRTCTRGRGEERLIAFDALRAPFKINDLSYNRSREYEALPLGQ